MLYPAELRARIVETISARPLIGQLLTLLFLLGAAPDSGRAAAASVAPTQTGTVEIELADGTLATPAALFFPGFAQRDDDFSPQHVDRQFVDDFAGGSLALAPGYHRDRYDRVVGRLFNGQGAAFDELAVKSGLALVDPARGDLTPETIERLLQLEREARAARRGLWRGGDLPLDASSDPDQLNGRFAIVKGRVLQATEAKQYLYLNFGDDWRSDFTIRVDKKRYRQMKRQSYDLATLAGRTISVRGWIFEDNGPMVELVRSEQIEITQ